MESYAKLGTTDLGFSINRISETSGKESISCGSTESKDSKESRILKDSKDWEQFALPIHAFAQCSFDPLGAVFVSRTLACLIFVVLSAWIGSYLQRDLPVFQLFQQDWEQFALPTQMRPSLEKAQAAQSNG